MDSRTINLLTSIYNTLQDIEVKGEKNCGYILGLSNAIKKYLQENGQESIGE